MAEEATTTLSAPAETTPVGTSSGATGTATTTPTANTGAAAPAESLPALDLNGIPKEFHLKLKAAHEKINNDFKSMYTPKLQGLAAEKTRWAEREKEWAQKEQQFQQLQTQIRDALVDPKKYEEYRARMGFAAPQPQPQEQIKTPETVGDLMTIIEQRVQQKLDGIRGYADQRTNQSIEGYARQTRWEAAEAAVKSDPVFQRYSGPLTHMALSDPRYRAMYNGANESEIINTVLKDFKDLRQHDLEETRQQTLTDLEKRKQSSTLPPSSTPSGAMTKPTGPRDVAAMVAAAKAKVGWAG